MIVHEPRNRAIVALRILGFPIADIVAMARRDVLRDGAVIGGTAHQLPAGMVRMLKEWMLVNSSWQGPGDPLFVALDSVNCGQRVSRFCVTALTKKYGFTTDEWMRIVKELTVG